MMTTTSGSVSRSMANHVVDIADLLGYHEGPDPADAPRCGQILTEMLRVRPILVDFSNVIGLTTAFTNALFLHILGAVGTNMAKERMRFRTASSFQRGVLKRSIQAAQQRLGA